MGYKPIEFRSTDGKWVLTETMYNDFCDDFPELDVMASVLDARAWSRANPPKKLVHRFLTNWLIRNRQNGVNLKIARTAMPHFTGTDYQIKAKERMWRKQPHLSKAAIDDAYQKEQAQRAAERDAAEPESVTDILRGAL